MERAIVWSKGSRHKVKAPAAFAELERIRESEGETLSPQAIVDASRPEDAVLHPEFEWDDSAAANEWRKEQARSIVQSIEIVQSDGALESRAPALVSVIVEGQRGYQPTSVAFEDAESAEFVIGEALAALASWKRRYEALRQHPKLAAIWRAVESIAS